MTFLGFGLKDISAKQPGRPGILRLPFVVFGPTVTHGHTPGRQSGPALVKFSTWLSADLALRTESSPGAAKLKISRCVVLPALGFLFVECNITTPVSALVKYFPRQNPISEMP